MNKVSYLWSKSVRLALILGLVVGGVLSAIVVGIVEYFGPNHSDWIKYSHDWFINIVVLGAVVGGIFGAVQVVLFASIVALFNIGNRSSFIIQLAWILETVIWVFIGILATIVLQHLRGEPVDMDMEVLLYWLFIMLLGVVAGFIGLRCAANKKDKGKEPLFKNPLHGLAVGLVLVPALIALIWTTVLAIMGW